MITELDHIKVMNVMNLVEQESVVYTAPHAPRKFTKILIYYFNWLLICYENKKNLCKVWFLYVPRDFSSYCWIYIVVLPLIVAVVHFFLIKN